MHELGLVKQIVKTVDSFMLEEGLTELEQINLNIGEMTDVVPKFIEEAWLAVREQTQFPQATMQVNVIRGEAKCQSCGHTDFVKNFGYECPKCKSSDLKITAGREFEIKEIIAK